MGTFAQLKLDIEKFCLKDIPVASVFVPARGTKTTTKRLAESTKQLGMWKTIKATLFGTPTIKNRSTIKIGDIFVYEGELYIMKKEAHVIHAYSYGESYVVSVCKKLKLVETDETIEILQGFTGEMGKGVDIPVVGRDETVDRNLQPREVIEDP